MAISLQHFSRVSLAALLSLGCVPVSAFANEIADDPYEDTLALQEAAYVGTSAASDFTYEFTGNDTLTLTSYLGSDAQVVIPSSINGYKVTMLGGSLFENNQSVETITVPEGVNFIDIDCFANSSVKTINLPSTWCRYFGGEFNGCNQLTAISVAPNNPEFCSIDGNLYSKNPQMLYFYASGKTETAFTVPSTVTEIWQNAFKNACYLQTLTISDSVINVGVGNYGKATDGKYSNFSGGVETVLGACFNGSSIKTINIGKGLKDIYGGCFGTNVEQINVDGGNPNFASESGVLYNKNKTMLVAYPAQKSGQSFMAPTSVTSVGSLAFYYCQDLKEVTFPAKITNLETGAFSQRTYPEGLQRIVFNKGMYVDNLLAATQFCDAELVDNSASNPSPALKGGEWVSSWKGWWYRYADGSYPTNAWLQVGGTWYHFDKNGYMQTGWQKINGVWYFLNSSGAMQTGWLKQGDTWYYLSPSGAMATGWVQVGGTWYYLKSSGAMATGWQQIGGAWYYLNSSGAMQTGWYKVGAHWYYSNASGIMQSNRWIGNYYVGASGAMATSQWIGNYYVDANGLWAK